MDILLGEKMIDWSKILTKWCPKVMKRKRGRQEHERSDDMAEITGTPIFIGVGFGKKKGMAISSRGLCP